MIETKFTKGNWSFGEQNGHCGVSINCDSGSRIATVYLGLVTSRVERGDDHFNLYENKESVANAHLVSAAPKMYRTLENILELGKLSPHQEDIVSALLAEARGESV